MLVLVYPIWETLFSMIRRARARRPFHEADSDHLHHLVAGADFVRQPGNGRYVAIPILICFAPFALAAPLLREQTPALLAAIGIFVALYSLTYRALGRRSRRFLIRA